MLQLTAPLKINIKHNSPLLLSLLTQQQTVLLRNKYLEWINKKSIRHHFAANCCSLIPTLCWAELCLSTTLSGRKGQTGEKLISTCFETSLLCQRDMKEHFCRPDLVPKLCQACSAGDQLLIYSQNLNNACTTGKHLTALTTQEKATGHRCPHSSHQSWNTSYRGQSSLIWAKLCTEHWQKQINQNPNNLVIISVVT